MKGTCRVNVAVLSPDSGYDSGEERAVGGCPVPSMSGISVRWIRNKYAADLRAYPRTPALIRVPSGILTWRKCARSTITFARNLSVVLGWGSGRATSENIRASQGVATTEVIMLKARTVKMGKNMVGQTKVDE
jgi:hypothetical protein